MPPIPKSPTDEVQDIADAFQKDCHALIDMLFKQPKLNRLTHADASMVWMFRKLAQMELRIRKLEAMKSKEEEWS